MTILRKIDFYINESLTAKYRNFLIGFDHIPFFPDQLEFFHFFQLYFFCPYFLWENKRLSAAPFPTPV